jgi:mevalonate kinase
VYGIPCIASGITKKTTAVLQTGTKPGFEIVDNRPAAKGYKEKYMDTQRASLARMNDKCWHLDFNKTPVRVTLGGDIYCASGVGASAASCVAMARAVSQAFKLNLSDEEINRCGLEGDKAYAGNPSGIDNTCSTYGGLVYFQRNLQKGGKNRIARLKLGQPLDVLMVSTGITTKTEVAVAAVRQRKDANPELYARYFAEAARIADDAKTALERGDLERVGALMAENHALLQKVGVSCAELDRLVSLALQHGAVGAKMTGGGMGGYIVALTPGTELQDKVAAAIEKEGFTVVKARIE